MVSIIRSVSCHGDTRWHPNRTTSPSRLSQTRIVAQLRERPGVLRRSRDSLTLNVASRFGAIVHRNDETGTFENLVERDDLRIGQRPSVSLEARCP